MAEIVIDTALGDAVAEAMEAIGGHERWAHDCHAASLALVRSGCLPGTARVARGSCRGAGGQHSWVVVDGDCYSSDARIVDPTLWSYDQSVHGVWIGSALEGRHVPHGKGVITAAPMPHAHGGEVVEPPGGLSIGARRFLQIIGPLDHQGWAMLANSPISGWPSREIITAMYHDDQLRPLVPVDIVGMLTDLNPGEMYR